VIVNTVDRATKVFAALEKLLKKEKKKKGIELKLVHSRFRGAERRGWDFLQRTATRPAQGRILVATQVVDRTPPLGAVMPSRRIAVRLR
jgi:CRISPR/Cas system-associated endonuclease/helicase Cas3